MRHVRLATALIGSALAPGAAAPTPARTPESIVREFLEVVRAGRDPEAATRHFAPLVQAHQVTSEGEATVARSPSEYADHVRDFKRAFGDCTFIVEELIAQQNRVYVRWRQQGIHAGSIAGETPAGQVLTGFGSAVYRVADDRIGEYWIQLDRERLELQLERAARRQGETTSQHRR